MLVWKKLELRLPHPQAPPTCLVSDIQKTTTAAWQSTTFAISHARSFASEPASELLSEVHLSYVGPYSRFVPTSFITLEASLTQWT